ncbi:protein APCDD1-like isoform X1 [Ciona intestinalis]
MAEIWSQYHKLCCILASIVISADAQYQRVNIWPEKDCSLLYANAHAQYGCDANNVTGTWVSTRCEVHSGPKFLIRFYEFRSDRHFLLRHHFYSDPDCTKPTVTMTTSGRFLNEDLLDSSLIMGATERRFVIKKIHLNVEDDIFTKTLHRLFNNPSRACSKCSKLYDEHMKKHHRLLVFSSQTNCDCTDELDFYLGELEVMKVVRVKDYRPPYGTVTQMFAGDVKTKIDNRRYYRSNTFQAPLERLSIMSSNVQMQIGRPVSPKLQRTLISPNSQQFTLHGNWLSVRCELRPHSSFLTRHLFFPRHGNVWSGVYRYYADDHCREPYYTLRAHGRYDRTSINPINGDADYVFDAGRMFITSQNENLTSLLNDAKREGLKLETHVEYDVTETEGIPLIDLSLPRREYDHILMRRIDGNLLLFTGRRPNDGRIPDSADKRATSYQDELLRCHSKCAFDNLRDSTFLCAFSATELPGSIETTVIPNKEKHQHDFVTMAYKEATTSNAKTNMHSLTLILSLLCIIAILKF